MNGKKMCFYRIKSTSTVLACKKVDELVDRDARINDVITDLCRANMQYEDVELTDKEQEKYRKSMENEEWFPFIEVYGCVSEDNDCYTYSNPKIPQWSPDYLTIEELNRSYASHNENFNVLEDEYESDDFEDNTPDLCELSYKGELVNSKIYIVFTIKLFIEDEVDRNEHISLSRKLLQKNNTSSS